MGISHFFNPILSFFLCKSCSACCNGGNVEFIFFMTIWGYIFFIRVAQLVYFLNKRCPGLRATWWEAVRLLEVVLWLAVILWSRSLLEVLWSVGIALSWFK